MKLPKVEIDQEQVMSILESCYAKVVDGVPGTPNCNALANEYLNKYTSVEIAAQQLIKNQITKCTTSGFITNVGGIITLPVALPANIVSVLYMQMRMIATLAVMGGYNVTDDEVQTLVYVCLVDTSVVDLCKKAGVNVAVKATKSLIGKIPGAFLTKLNQLVGFRLITKFGTKGVINLGQMAPVVGGFVGGGLDFVMTKRIAKRAYKMFIQNLIE